MGIGELTRSFLKHKAYGTVYCIEVDETGEILAAGAVSEAAVCRHRKGEIDLNLDDAKEVEKHRREFEPFDPGCSDATHWLSDIATQEKACAEAEESWKAAHADAKAKKEMLESQQTELRRLVREATSPKSLPLFNSAA